MIYGSVCSGIEAASVAWGPLGWRAAFLSEIEPFPRAVLAHHYPRVPLHGDFTTIGAGRYEPIDLLAGGTPCQSFSVAGLRGGMADERGNLALEYLRLADRLRPRWLVWENVPGVLSSADGRDFGSFLGGLGQLGYGFAYRVLDAQYFGLAQRRKRVFVVGYLGDWRRAAAVLFEPAGLRWDTPPRREAGERPARCLANGSGSVGGQRYDGESEDSVVANTLRVPSHGATWRGDGCDNLVSHSLRAEGFDASEDGTGRRTPLVPVHPYTLAIRGRGDSHDLEYRQDGTANAILTPNGGRGGAVAFDARQSDVIQYGDKTGPLDTDGHTIGVLSINENQRGELRLSEQIDCMSSGGGKPGQGYPAALHGAAVRRLTPRECERLQGFPDNYTLIQYRGKPAADGPRYRALGNSMAVPCMAWIGRRIAAQEAEMQTTRERIAA